MNYLFFLLLLPLTTVAQTKTICGDDQRTPSFVKEIGRATKPGAVTGCTVTMIGKTCAVSAGHCYRDLSVILFNTYLENEVLTAAAEDTYEVDTASLVSQNGYTGKDWSVFRIKANAKSGKLPGVAQGTLPVNDSFLPKAGDQLTITGFGHRSPTLRGNDPQQTHADVVSAVDENTLYYTVDTMGGNSGAALLNVHGEIIGVHTHGGCGSTSGDNKGTLLAGSASFKAAINACLAWEQASL